MSQRPPSTTRRVFLGAAAAAIAPALVSRSDTADIAITLDLEMSRDYPRRGMTEWDYEKGNLDEPTKRYAVETARLVREAGGVVHFFCVGRTLEQADIGWLKRLAEDGHPIGNHTYDHVNLLAPTPVDAQFRFQRAPWLVRGKTIEQVLRDNIAMTTEALRERAGIEAAGFRTPGGFSTGLAGREDLQRMLLELGFTWVSSLYPRHPTGESGRMPGDEVLDEIALAQRRAQPFRYPTGLVEVPMSPVSDVTVLRAARWPLEGFLRAIERAVRWAIDERAAFDFLAHPSCLCIEDPQFRAVRLICRLVAEHAERARIVPLDRLAARGLMIEE